MDPNDRNIRIFISSTFRDMHAERDHLVRFVFPELKEKCRKHRVNLIDVDLRWGVTEEDAEDGKALDICLDEIDSCRPYFLGLLGHRYGHTPPSQAHSITAQEIFHGVLHNDIPQQVVNLRPIIEGRLEGKAPTQEQIDCLVRCYQWNADKGKYLLKADASPEELEIIRGAFQQYSTYQRDRSFFFFRSDYLTGKLAGENPEDFFETDRADQNKLVALKQEIIDEGLYSFEYDEIEAFGDNVRDVLWERIEAEIGEHVEEEKNWLEEETKFHELFIADRTRRFVGRQELRNRLQAFCENDGEPSILVITGEPGSGKSALMGRFTEDALRNYPDWLIMPHFIGASPNSASLRQTLKRFCTHLKQLTGYSEVIPEDIRELTQIFPDLLIRAADQYKILIILDAVNQFEAADNAHNMRWLPQDLPENVRVVISTLKGGLFDVLQSRRVKPEALEIEGLNENEIKKLVTEYLDEIRREFPNKQVSQTFYEKIKAGNPLYIQVALEELRVFGEFEELANRVNSLPDNVPALFDQVLERIEADFDQALVRDCMSFIACGKFGMTADELQTLLRTHAPKFSQGTSIEKLPDMIWAKLCRAFSSYLFERSGVIDFFHGQLKEAVGKRYLKKEADRTRAHQSIAEYFEARWREPCDRALDELPHQRMKAEDWQEIEQLLTDLTFVEAKCMAGMTIDLMADYNVALASLPEVAAERQKALEYEERIEKYTQSLIAYAKGEIERLDIIPSVRSWSREESQKDADRMANSAAWLDRIKIFSRFVHSESHRLLQFGYQPGFCFQQACNYADSGPVVAAAERIVAAERAAAPLFLRHAVSRPVFNPLPSLVRTLVGHTNTIDILALTLDGSLAISGNSDNTLWLWDMACGECLDILEGHTGRITSVAMTPNGLQAVSGSLDGTLRLWDLKRRVCLKILEGHTEGVTSVDMTPDGHWAVSGSSDKTLRVWDLTGLRLKKLEEEYTDESVIKSLQLSGQQTKIRWLLGCDISPRSWALEQEAARDILNGHTDAVCCVAVTPDGRQAVSGGSETLWVWDLEDRICLKTLVIRTGADSGILMADGKYVHQKNPVTSLALTPDGRRAVSASTDETLRVWDLDSGLCLKTLERQTEDIKCVALTPDGCKVVSGGSDNTLLSWDLERRSCRKNIEGHTDTVTCVALTPDGRQAISGSSDKTLRVWDLERGLCQKPPEQVSTSRIDKMALTSDGRLVVAGGFKASVWNLESGECLKAFWMQSASGGLESLVLTPDGRKAVVGGNFDGSLSVWDLETGTCDRTLGEKKTSIVLSRSSDIRRGLEGHTGNVECLIVTPDGRRVVSGSSDNTLRVWDLERGECLRIMTGHTGEVNSVVMTLDSCRVISGSADHTLRVWDLGRGVCLKILEGHTDEVNSVAITLDGRRMISGSKDLTLRVWDLESEECLYVLEGYTGHVNSVALSLDGQRVILGNSDSTLRVWDLESGECFKTLSGHKDMIMSVVPTPDGRRVVSGSSDGTLRVWDLDSGACLGVYLADAEVAVVSGITEDGHFSFGTDSGKVIILMLHDLRRATRAF